MREQRAERLEKKPNSGLGLETIQRMYYCSIPLSSCTKVLRYKAGQNFVLERAFQVGRTKRILSTKRRYDRVDVLGPETSLLERLLIRTVLSRKPIVN
jgi:hypothetical protein